MAKLYYGEGKKKQGHKALTRKKLATRLHVLFVYAILAALILYFNTRGQ